MAFPHKPLPRRRIVGRRDRTRAAAIGDKRYGWDDRVRGIGKTDPAVPARVQRTLDGIAEAYEASQAEDPFVDCPVGHHSMVERHKRLFCHTCCEDWATWN